MTLIGGFFLVAMIVLTCANVFLRVVWVPVRGTFELMGYAGAIVAAFALAFTQQKRGHIAVDILISGFSAKTRRILNIINNILCFLFFVIVAWQVAEKAAILRRTGEVTETLQIIYYPFTYAVSLGCLVLGLALFTELLQSIFPSDLKTDPTSGEGPK